MRSLTAITALSSLALVLSCGEKKPTNKDENAGKTVDSPHAAQPEKPKGLAAPNTPPTLEIPAYKQIGVGQEIGFGIEVIDEESDVVAVDLIAKPSSASFDHPTLTVVWTPTKADMPAGLFRVRIEERRRDDGSTRAFIHEFAIEVTAAKQPLPQAQPLGPAVEELITIHDPERLALANAKWPIDVLLHRAAESAASDLKADKKDNGATVPDRKAVYESFLHNLALAHQNDSVDPKSPAFDAKLWADPSAWKIIAIRPRLDKKWHELRIVYKAKAHAASYAMFKFRPYAAHSIEAGSPDENNKAMAELTLRSFFNDKGELNPAFTSDKKAHAAAVEAYMTSIVEYSSEGKPWAEATFLGLPMEARLGGGTKRKADGSYESGDAWGWHVMKALPEGGSILLRNIPIQGFLTAVKPSADGKEWAMACGTDFEEGKPAAKLCRPTGHADMPATGEGYAPVELSKIGAGGVVSSLVDAANMHLEYKDGMTRSVELDDPRRDLFEENGMTCSQCHVRKFGVRDMNDRTAYDPSAGTPTTANKKQDTTYFVITPTEKWQPYAIDFQHKQECKIKAAIERATGATTALICPLAAE